MTIADTEAEGIDAESFRQVMGHLPSAVTVVTAATQTEKRGVTIGSFTSLSLTPPLVSFNLGRRSHMYSVLTASPRFAVHVLTGQQSDLSSRFAVPGRTGEEQFGELCYHTSEEGIPVLQDAATVLWCVLYDIVDVGEKSIIIGHVQSADTDLQASVLLYHQRRYASLNGTVHPVDDLVSISESSGPCDGVE